MNKIKTILVYDTETTGLPLFSQPSDDPRQPYITQLAAELCVEETGEVLGSMNVLIDPKGIWTISEELEQLTGISTQKAARYGIGSGTALDMFMQLWQGADVRVAHNESFDMRMIRIAMMRDDNHRPHADDWKAGQGFCTCVNSTAIVNMPPTEKMKASGKHTPKPPKLTEAYKHFFNEELDGAHNAMIDVQGCKRVYYALRKTEEVAA